MKIKYVIASILLFCCIIPDVNALCSKSDILRARIDANNITPEINRLKDEQGKYTGKYNIIFKGFTKDFYIKEKNTGIIYAYNSVQDGNLIVKNIEGGNLEFNIYYQRCSDEHMRTIKYNLPKYNYYSDSPLCEGISESELEICGNWYRGELTEESFNEQINKYREELEQKQLEEQSKDTILNRIKNYLIEYYIYIISGIILIVIIVSLIVFRKKQYSLD